MTNRQAQSGFSIIELTVATAVLLIVSSIVTNALMTMTKAQTTIWNRTEMHSGIRGATELLQQEVGQAGRIALPGTVTLAETVVPIGACDPEFPLNFASQVDVATTSTKPGVTAVTGMWAAAGPPASYIMMSTLDGNNQETFRVGAIDGSTSPATIRACFEKTHAIGTVIVPMGGFGTGIVPNTGMVDGSSATVLKMYGDINGDGQMVYVEYTCDAAGTHNLYRNVMALDAPMKDPLGDDKILLSNIMENPGGTDCFTYQTVTKTAQGTPFTFVLDVAVTLTVQTQQVDPVTHLFQQETKALLNVSPRNVFNTFSLVSIGYTDRIQSTPVSVTTLLPPLP